jgi:hypothetical protein
MKKTISILAALAALNLAPVAQAQSIEEKNLAKGKFAFEPDAGYIYLSGPTRQTGLFLKMPSQADVDEYTAEWEKQLAKAQEKYVKKLKSWEQAKKTAEQTKSKPPEKPVEPTRENFSIGSIETRNPVSFGPEFVFSKDKEKPEYTYMMKVRPGTYVYHGPLFFNPQAGYVGTCYCMGSVQVEVKAGVITDLGNFLLAAPGADIALGIEAPPMVVPTGMFSSTVNEGRPGEKVRFGLPESLKAYPSAVGDFRAAAKSDNHFGVMISRMPPIPGVLGYQRDKVVDLKAPAEQPVATQ